MSVQDSISETRRNNDEENTSLYNEAMRRPARNCETLRLSRQWGTLLQRPALWQTLWSKSNYMGRRLSMLSILESVELRPAPLSLTRSLMRMLGLLVLVVAPACDVGGGVLPSLRGGGGCRGAL
jgi:hypothetical protein